jgi:hypothetical protein
LRSAAKEKQRNDGRADYGREHDDVEDEKTATEPKKVGNTAEPILWGINWTHRLVVTIHSNGLARYEVIQERKHNRTAECADQTANAQRRCIMKDMRRCAQHATDERPENSKYCAERGSRAISRIESRHDSAKHDTQY